VKQGAMLRIIQVAPERERPLRRRRSGWGVLAGRDEAPEGRRRGVHPVEAAALAVPGGQQLMIVAIYGQIALAVLCGLLVGAPSAVAADAWVLWARACDLGTQVCGGRVVPTADVRGRAVVSSGLDSQCQPGVDARGEGGRPAEGNRLGISMPPRHRGPAGAEGEVTPGGLDTPGTSYPVISTGSRQPCRCSACNVSHLSPGIASADVARRSNIPTGARP
jgi:hypothetical protein